MGHLHVAANLRAMHCNGGRVDMLPTSFHDVTVLLEVGASTWQRILDAAGENERLKGQPFTHDGLWKSLATDAPAAGSDLLDALEVLHELGTDGGRDLIQQAAEDQQVDLQSSDDEPSREFAARVWIQSLIEKVVVSLVVTAALCLAKALVDHVATLPGLSIHAGTRVIVKPLVDLLVETRD